MFSLLLVQSVNDYIQYLYFESVSNGSCLLYDTRSEKYKNCEKPFEVLYVFSIWTFALKLELKENPYIFVGNMQLNDLHIDFLTVIY